MEKKLVKKFPYPDIKKPYFNRNKAFSSLKCVFKVISIYPLMKINVFATMSLRSSFM